MSAGLQTFLLLFLVTNTLMMHAEFYSLVERYRRQQTGTTLDDFSKVSLAEFCINLCN